MAASNLPALDRRSPGPRPSDGTATSAGSRPQRATVAALAPIPMHVERFGDGDPLVWVMGWGNVAGSRHERWLIEQFVDAGYAVHAVELPTTTTDFERDCVAPVREHVADLDAPALVAHSMGGLALSHVDPDRPAVYLSPWWGMQDLPAVVEPLLRLPIATPFVPVPGDPSELGELATADDDTGPSRIAPRWIQTVRRHQRTLPALDPGDRVFYAPDDRVVDPDAIVAHTTPEQRRTYDGGHELFASSGRDEHVDRVLDALAGLTD